MNNYNGDLSPPKKKEEMTKYEGTIILKETGRENTVEEVQNLISAEIDSAGGKVGEFNATGFRFLPCGQPEKPKRLLHRGEL